MHGGWLIFRTPSSHSTLYDLALSPLVRSAFISPKGITDIAIDPNTRIQVIDEIAHLAGARKHQFAAFVRSENCLVVWSDEVDTIMESAEALEQRMIQYVWASKAHEQQSKPLTSIGEDGEEIIDSSGVSMRTGAATMGTEKRGSIAAIVAMEENEIGGGWTEENRRQRPVQLLAPVITGLAILLNMTFVGLGIRELTLLSSFSIRPFELTCTARSIDPRWTRHRIATRWQLHPIRPPRFHALYVPSRHGQSLSAR
jgi:hypothetical protein